jgi:hypothetical protein
MIEIKPNIQHRSNCPYCESPLNPVKVRWQGMHVCVDSKCINCQTELLDSLRIGHAVHKPFQLDLVKEVIFGHTYAKGGLAQALIQSLQNPEPEQLEISKEVFKPCQKVIILNCIDHLYGHCLLKLLNAQRHLDCHPDYGLIIIVPQFLRWMVPEGVAEIWSVQISLKNAQCYYPSFAEFVSEELKRFDKVFISKAYSHPSQFDITRFTGVPKHSFEQDNFKITFIWREDRPWCSLFLFRILRKLKIIKLGIFLQNWRVVRLFEKIRSKVPEVKFEVAGLGMQTKFPNWIEDLRVDKFNEKIEREMCTLYSQSRLVIGIHGSNMLLPSGHAGMTLDLMPERWGNFAQDILYQETDPRLAAFRYRYLPLHTSTNLIANIASSMLLQQSDFYSEMTADKLVSDHD